jgi:hypothetical protein
MEIKDCPRCSEPIPNREFAGMYAGAISRVDNTTEICSECGVIEAMIEFAGQYPFRFTDQLVQAVLNSGFADLYPRWIEVAIDKDYTTDFHPKGFSDEFIDVETEYFTSRLSRRDIVRGVKYSAIEDEQIRKMWRDGVRTEMYFFTQSMGDVIMEKACQLKWEEEHEDLMYPNTMERWTQDGTQRIS